MTVKGVASSVCVCACAGISLPVGGVSLTGEVGGAGFVTVGGGAGLGRAGDEELTTLMLLVVNLEGELGGAVGREGVEDGG